MYPRFLGIGAQKAGTTWLHTMLSEHEEIWLPHLKELHYFDRKFPIKQNSEAIASQPRAGVLRRHFSTRLRRIDIGKLKERFKIRRWGDLTWEMRYLFGKWDDEWYASLFSRAGGRLPGEITPAYSCLSEPAISYVHALMPEAKLILLLRNPIDRAWSHATMDLARSRGQSAENVTDAEYVAHFASSASRLRGDYSRMTGRWLKSFSKSQLFIGYYDEIQSSPTDLLTRIFQFLGVSASEASIPRNIGVRINAGSHAPLPAHLRRYLESLYIDELRAFAVEYGSYPQQWLDACKHALRHANGTSLSKTS